MRTDTFLFAVARDARSRRRVSLARRPLTPTSVGLAPTARCAPIARISFTRSSVSTLERARRGGFARVLARARVRRPRPRARRPRRRADRLDALGEGRCSSPSDLESRLIVTSQDSCTGDSHDADDRRRLRARPHTRTDALPRALPRASHRPATFVRTRARSRARSVDARGRRSSSASTPTSSRGASSSAHREGRRRRSGAIDAARWTRFEGRCARFEGRWRRWARAGRARCEGRVDAAGRESRRREGRRRARARRR